jgi:hypothetical protein
MKRPHSSAAADNLNTGFELIRGQPALKELFEGLSIRLDKNHEYVSKGGWWVLQYSDEVVATLWLHPKRLAPPPYWARVISLPLIALGLGLVQQRKPQHEWDIVALLTAARLAHELRVGDLPDELALPALEIPAGGPERLFASWQQSDAERLQGTAQKQALDWYAALTGVTWSALKRDERDTLSYLPYAFQFKLDIHLSRWGTGNRTWKQRFADGLTKGVTAVVEQAGFSNTQAKQNTVAQKALRQILDHYPLLGAMAASFDLEEDPDLLRLHDVSIAAIHVESRKIWINPHAGLNINEARFVIAHELLHAGLNHTSRARGRDAQLWNVACDFAINSWLIDMQIGSPPDRGLLYDPAFANLSAE